ncbi:MAG: topoisomerase [Alteromonadaceae bacterium]|nr:topoisomerase [Alteromonadaceae bacterium]
MESKLLGHTSCLACDSSDAMAVYDDGHAHCFSCNTTFQDFEEGKEPQVKVPEPSNPELVTDLAYQDIPSRGISSAVCRSHGYGIGMVNGQPVQVANYRDAAGDVVGQKVKGAGKKFAVRGDLKAAGLWQQHRWGSGGKHLLVTEGETDCLAWQTISGDRFAAVSIPNGAAGAAKAIRQNIDFVDSFGRVVLCFDNDEAGRLATEQVANILTPGKVAVMSLPEGCNDICDAVQKGHAEKLTKSFWHASPRRPDGIVAGEDLVKALLNPPEMGLPYPWVGLTEKLGGIRKRELVTITAGTGVGKSLMAGLIGTHLIKSGAKIGYISLEESLTRTTERLVAAEMQTPLHVSRDHVDPADIEKCWRDVFDGNVCIYNHFGSVDAETLLQRVKHMRIAEGVDYVIVDHLSILVSGWGDGDERRLIDNVMTALRSVCEQTGVGMFLISHLRAPQGGEASHEEGGRPKINQLRGSKAISQLSDAVIAIQRNQLCEEHSNRSTVWVLKNRHLGIVGEAGTLDYSPDSGTMTEVIENKETDDSPF